MRLAIPSTAFPFAIAPVVALADGGESDSDGGGESDSDGGGESDSDGGESGDDGGNSGSGGADDGDGDNSGPGGGEDDGDDGDHGTTGSSIGGFLGALVSHGRVSSAQVSGDSVVVTYSDGWSEQVAKGRYQLRDRKNRIVVNRRARTMDVKRLKAAARR